MMPKHLTGVGWGEGGGSTLWALGKEGNLYPAKWNYWLSTSVRATRKVFFFSQLPRSFFPLAKQTASYAS